MALSNTPKDTITTVQVLLDIAEALKKVVSGDLGQLAKDAYALPQQEEARAVSARADIAANQAVLAEIKKKEADLEKLQLSLDEKKAEIGLALRSIEQGNRQLDMREKSLNESGDQQKEEARRLAQAQAEIASASKKLTADQSALEIKQQEIDSREAILKEKAAQLQLLTKGL